MNRKLLSLITALLLCICNSFANNGDTFKASIDGIEVQFKVTDENAKEAQVGTGNGRCVDMNTSGTLNIPSVINGYTITAIGVEAFYSCEAIDEVKLPNSIKTIQTYAFYYSSISSIVLPEGLTEIHNEAFAKCYKLKKIRLPHNISQIQQDAFYCAAIEEITIGCKSVQKIWSKDLTSVKKMTIESTVEDVEEGAFAMPVLNTLSVNSEKIGEWFPYGGKSSITHLTLGNNVKEIHEYAFTGATGITTLVLPPSLEFIGNYAFSDCTGVSALVIPSSVHTIEHYAFDGCSNLTAISVNPGNQTFDSRENCNAIIETATNTLFMGCSSTTIPSTIEKIGPYAFARSTCPSSLELPPSVTEICEFAFVECADIKHIEIPQSVTRIGEAAFYHSGIMEIRIPESVTAIEDNLFFDCNSLKTVILPSSLQQIGYNAFAESPVEKLVVLAEQPVALDQSALNRNSRPYLFVPQNSIPLYQNAYTWSNCKAVYPINHIVHKNAIKEYGDDIDMDYIMWNIESSDTGNGWWMNDLTIKMDADKNSPVGEYKIKFSYENNWAISRKEFCVFDDAVLIITKAPLTVSVKDVTITQGSEVPTFQIDYSGFKLDENESVLSDKPVATTTATSQSSVGEYEITLSGGDAQNYSLSYVSGKLTIIDASSGITSVNTSASKLTVYDIQGNKIFLSSKSIDDLSKGVYIVNGKKVVIK